MDSSARSSDRTAQYRLELSRQSSPSFLTLVTRLDAIEGSQLLRACRNHLRPHPSTAHLTSTENQNEGVAAPHLS